jgi:putative heme-binding domain-containing protein
MLNLHRRPCAVALLTLLTLCGARAAPVPQPDWIWHGPMENATCYLRRSFTLPAAPTQAVLRITVDNFLTAYLNGEPCGRSEDWPDVVVTNVTARLRAGENVLAAKAGNDGSNLAGLVAQLDLQFAAHPPQRIVSDTNWLAATAVTTGWERVGFAADGWAAPRALGPLGRAPWGDVFSRTAAGRAATPAESLTVAEGFQVELLHSAAAGEGSWVSMTVDPQGRLYISPQGGEPILRLTLDGAGRIAKQEPLDLPLRAAMGLLWAHDSLYVNGGGPQGYCLYRVTDTNRDDVLDHVVRIHATEGGGGEHGTHGVVNGPDGRLHVICGNFVKAPADAPTRPHRNYAEDLVLPRAEDGNGFGAGEKPPGGFVMRMDPDGGNCELFAAGQRNAYDLAFNADGELFSFDSDMEWDWALPWYRPTRIFHLTSGAEHGYRGGSGKWPEHYPDSLPAVLNVGVGSPTGVRFGTGAKFPAKYQRALFAMDWSYGRLLAVHLTPQGAGYTGVMENFVTGRPLNLTDLEVGADGALYFITGGRGTQSGLYRVTYAGTASTAPADAHDQAGAKERALRHRLERFHGRTDPAAVAEAWPLLGSPDRYLRHAARIALEAQPAAEWQARALQEQDVATALTALLALARVGGAEARDATLDALTRFPLARLPGDTAMGKLRVIEVALARHGPPAPERRQALLAELRPLFPASSDALNRELAQVLIALEAPDLVAPIMALARQATTLEQQTAYLFPLRLVRTGWTLADRVAWFSWFNPAAAVSGGLARATTYDPVFTQWFTDVGSRAREGSSYPGFMRAMRKAGLAQLSDAEKLQLTAVLAPPQAAAPTAPAGPAPTFVKDWKISDFGADLEKTREKTNLRRGREAFSSSLCAVCHRFGDEGGAVGPDLTAVASRFTRRDLLANILEPSKVVSEQYAQTVVTKKDGSQITGRITEDTADHLQLMPSPLAPDFTIAIPKAEVASQALSPYSSMPPGLLNLLSKDEILDLLAFLESGAAAVPPAP